MTTYFDAMTERVRKVRDRNLADVLFAEALAPIERELVRDVTIAAELPGFPPHLREPLHRTVLKHAAVTLPRGAPAADWAEDHEYAARLERLIWDLHTLFHAVSACGVYGFNDAPTTPLDALYDRGDTFREQLCAAPADHVVPTEDPAAWPTQGITRAGCWRRRWTPERWVWEQALDGHGAGVWAVTTPADARRVMAAPP